MKYPCAGNAARFGLEAALLARDGVHGNPRILELDSGFPAFFPDWAPCSAEDMEVVVELVHVRLFFTA